MSSVKTLFTGPPKPKKQDTSAIDAQLALQKKQQKQQDEETASRARVQGSRAAGRQLLLNKATGDQGLASTLGG